MRVDPSQRRARQSALQADRQSPGSLGHQQGRTLHTQPAMHRRHQRLSRRRRSPYADIRLKNIIRALIYETALTLGFLWGVASLIWRYFLAEFLIIFGAVGWTLSSLVSANELHGHAGFLQVSEYLL